MMATIINKSFTPSPYDNKIAEMMAARVIDRESLRLLAAIICERWLPPARDCSRA